MAKKRKAAKVFPVKESGVYTYYFDKEDMLEFQGDFDGGVVCMITTIEGRDSVLTQLYGGFHLFETGEIVSPDSLGRGKGIALGKAGMDLTEGRHLDHYLITDLTNEEEIAEHAHSYLIEACALTLFNKWTENKHELSHHDIKKHNELKETFENMYGKDQDSTRRWSK